jgi:hypothetical protein
VGVSWPASLAVGVFVQLLIENINAPNTHGVNLFLQMCGKYLNHVFLMLKHSCIYFKMHERYMYQILFFQMCMNIESWNTHPTNATIPVLLCAAAPCLPTGLPR